MDFDFLNNINISDDDLPEIEDKEIKKGTPLKDGDIPLSNKDIIIDAIKLIFDPEIQVDIYNLGLIYNIDLQKNGDVNITMTLTSPTCPMADEIPIWVADSVTSLDGVGVVTINLVWDPAWDLSRLSEDAKFQLEINDLDLDSISDIVRF